MDARGDRFVCPQPPMNDARRKLVEQAFDKLDVDGTGTITADDLKKSHDFSHNPKVLRGEETVDQLLTRHLAMFEGGGATDGKVRGW